MPETRGPQDRAVSAAAASASRRGLLPALLAFVVRWTVPARNAHTLDDQLAASVPGYGDIRFYGDMPAADIASQRARFVPPASGEDGRAKWLVLSAGGAGGAFGAGVLTGWFERGDRPAFDYVTGISAGALLAPFAFLGADADGELSRLFTAQSVAGINRSRSFLAGIFGRAAISGTSLREVIDAHLTERLAARIALRHRAGARLFVVTTNLDAERSVVWDIGAIASSDNPDRLRLIGDVLQASASLPAVFPPVRIAVEANGRTFEELHADGGIVRQTYLLPDALHAATEIGASAADVYVIANGEIVPSFWVVPEQSILIAERALVALEKAKLAHELADMADLVQRCGSTFRLTHIDRTLPIDRRIPFDPRFMRNAFELGRAKGRECVWQSAPPVGTGFMIGAV